MNEYKELVSKLEELKKRAARDRAGLYRDDGSLISKSPETLDKIDEYHNTLIAIEQVEARLAAYRRTVDRLLGESELGERFAARTFETFEAERFPTAYKMAKEYAEGFLDNKGQGLILTGNSGTGKTHLAAAIVNYVIATYGIPARFINYMDLLARVKAAFGSREDVIAGFARVPLLVIDDLANVSGEWRSETLYRIVNTRYEHNAPIILTSNSGYEELSEAVQEKTVSRLLEMCAIVEMNGEDYRRRGLSG